MKSETEKAKNLEAIRLKRVGLKKCSKCGEIKPIDQFAKGKRYARHCNACKQKKHDAYNKKNLEAIRLKRVGLKKCSKCGEIKPIDQFAEGKPYARHCNACKQKKHYAYNKKRREKAINERGGQIKCRICCEYREKHFFSIEDLRDGRYKNLTCISCKSLNEPPLIEPKYDKIIRINKKLYVEVAYVGDHKCAHCAIDNDFICNGIDCNGKYYRRYNGKDVNEENNNKRRNLYDKFRQIM